MSAGQSGSGCADPSTEQDERTWYWKGTEVPRRVHDTLHTSYRGQTGIGKDHVWVLDRFWKEETELVSTPGIPFENKKHVFTVLTYKNDATFFKRLSHGNINVGKIIEAMFKSPKVSDEVCTCPLCSVLRLATFVGYGK